ncbi:Aminotransferase-like, plant mobile domain [Sesbania bispinosa]|nr:Aminotransferase-like, plant mobile domain [Sesbania bispinosa]
MVKVSPTVSEHPPEDPSSSDSDVETSPSELIPRSISFATWTHLPFARVVPVDSSHRRWVDDRDPPLRPFLPVLLLRWSHATHTFFAAWGEFTPTLEDVCVLLKLPAFGDCDISSLSIGSHLIDMAKDLKAVTIDNAKYSREFLAKRCAAPVPPSDPSSKTPLRKIRGTGNVLPPERRKAARESLKYTYATWVRYFFGDYDAAMKVVFLKPTSELPVFDPSKFIPHDRVGRVLDVWVSYYARLKTSVKRYEGQVSMQVFPNIRVMHKDPYFVTTNTKSFEGAGSKRGNDDPASSDHDSSSGQDDHEGVQSSLQECSEGVSATREVPIDDFPSVQKETPVELAPSLPVPNQSSSIEGDWFDSLCRCFDQEPPSSALEDLEEISKTILIRKQNNDEMRAEIDRLKSGLIVGEAELKNLIAKREAVMEARAKLVVPF